MPAWLHTLSIAALLLGAICLVIVLVDVARHPQRMGIMNVVWPVTALFGTFLVVAGYFRYGRMSAGKTARTRDIYAMTNRTREQFHFRRWWPRMRYTAEAGA